MYKLGETINDCESKLALECNVVRISAYIISLNINSDLKYKY